MRLFIQLENGTPKAWPLIGDNVRYLAPVGTSFPASPDAYEEADLSEFGFETFIDVPSPAFEPLTHRLVDDIPIQIDGQWTRQWQVLALDEATAAASRDLARTTMAAQIDAAVAAVYGCFTRFAQEYVQREAQAQAYKDAGYTGTVPARVAGFATPAGMAAQAATDLILSQAAQLRGALDELSDLRMQKYSVTRAATDGEAQAVFDSTMTSIAAIAAALA